MRLDKYLKVSRIIKRRTFAKDICDDCFVLVNQKEAKPSHQLKIGDIISIKYQNELISYKVLQLKEHVRKEETTLMYEVIH